MPADRKTQTSANRLMADRNVSRQMQIVGRYKVTLFDRSKSLRLRRLTAENLCSSATVVRVDVGELA